MDELNLGKKLKAFRTMRNISIRELSEKIDVTPSMLSQIERSLVNPSINTLLSISKALDIPIFNFFKEDFTNKELVVRRDKRKTIGLPEEEDVLYDLLTPDVSGNIEFCMMHIPPQRDAVKITQRHKGEEVAYIVEGTVDIIVDKIRYALNEGDSIRIPPLSEHIWENIYDKNVKVVFAVSPPSF